MERKNRFTVIRGEGLTDEEFRDDFRKQVLAQEQECLNQILLRYCILKGKKIDITRCTAKEFPDRGNYWEWWYDLDKPDAYMLFQRELKVIPGEDLPVLQIVFNRELI